MAERVRHNRPLKFSSFQKKTLYIPREEEVLAPGISAKPILTPSVVEKINLKEILSTFCPTFINESCQSKKL